MIQLTLAPSSRVAWPARGIAMASGGSRRCRVTRRWQSGASRGAGVVDLGDRSRRDIDVTCQQRYRFESSRVADSRATRPWRRRAREARPAATPSEQRACDSPGAGRIATRPWLPPSAMSVGRSCIGAMLASSSRISSTGGWASRRFVRGVARSEPRPGTRRFGRSRISPTMRGPTCAWVSPVAQM